MPFTNKLNLLSAKASCFFLISPKYMLSATPTFITTQRNYFSRNQRIINLAIFKPTYSASRYFCEQSPQESPQQTLADVKNKLSKIMGVQKGFRPLPPNRAHLLQYLPETQDELPVRSMKDSFDSALIPLSSDPLLQDRYMTLMGNVRKGRLLEDMDIYAVWICLKHIKNPKINPDEPFPYTIVTACVDQIDFQNWHCKVTDDMKISGHVQWVGKSSMEVCVWLESLVLGQWKLFTKAYFIMVARNSTNTGTAFVNKLKPEGPDEEMKHEKARQRIVRMHNEQKASLLKIPPTEDEQRKIHEMFMKTVDFKDPTLNHRILPSNSVWMESTKITNMLFPHPEDRNTHNKVFGGLLMRLSSELSWIVAFTHGKHRPTLRHISDITFKSPVSINSFVRMTGQVVYTEQNFAQIVVHCELLDIMTSKLFTSNVFNYTYECNHILQEVVPQTYLDAMMWLDGRRHFQEVMG